MSLTEPFEDQANAALFEYYRQNIKAVSVHLARPITYAEATSGTNYCGQVSLTAADFVVSLGQSGYSQRLDFEGATIASSTKSGTASWLAFLDTVNQTFFTIPTAAPVSVVTGVQIDIAPREALCQMEPSIIDLVE